MTVVIKQLNLRIGEENYILVVARTSFSSYSFKQFEQESEPDSGLRQSGMWEGA